MNILEKFKEKLTTNLQPQRFDNHGMVGTKINNTEYVIKVVFGLEVK